MLVLAVLSAGAATLALIDGPATTVTRAASSPSVTNPAASDTESGGDQSETVVPGKEVAPPATVQIPAIGVDTPLEQLRLADDGSLSTPRNPLRAGWFVGGPRPGEVGPAVVVGHRDSRDGPAVFWRLSELRRGDRIVVAGADGTGTTFAVRRVELVPQADFPTELVYAPTPARALRLITCGGDYDHLKGRYKSNVIVFAEAVG